MLMAAAAEVAPGAEGLFFLPYLAGERTPHMDPHARAAWIGLDPGPRSAPPGPRSARGRELRAQGLARSDAAARGQARALFAVGGGARSPVWRQILAAVLGVRLQRLAVEEGPAMGAALLAAVGAGVHADVDAAVAAAVRTAGEPEAPDAEWAARYRALHRRFARPLPRARASGRLVSRQPPDVRSC